MITNRRLTTEMYLEVKAEVERLKSEHERIVSGEVALNYNKGREDGEVDALRRVKEAIERAKKRSADTSEGRAYYLAVKDIETELGFDDEVRS